MKRVGQAFEFLLLLACSLFSCSSNEVSSSPSSLPESSEPISSYEMDAEGFYVLEEDYFAYREDPSDTKEHSKIKIPEIVQDQPIYGQMRMFIGGRSVPIYNVKTNFSQIWNAEAPNRINNAVASFGLKGKAEIKLQLSFNSERHIKISPLEKEVPFSYDKGRRVISFMISSPGQYTVELTNDRVLHLFVNDLSIYENPFSDAIVFEKGIHNRQNDPRINRNNEIVLSSNQKVYLEDGAFVQGKFIASNAENIQIIGPGYIDGAPFVRNANTGQVLVPIEFNDCSNVTLKDFAVIDPAGWCFNLYFCNGLLLDNCKVISSRSNGDGISVQSCKNAEIRNCFVRSWDDSLVVKNYPRWGNRNIEGETDSILFDSCILWTDLAQSMEIGFECVGEKMKNISFSNITVLHNFHKPVFSIHNGNNANIETVRYSNITVEDASMGKGDGNNALIEIAVGYSSTWSDQHKVTALGSIQDVKFSNIKVVDGRINPAVKVNGCIDPRGDYPKTPHIVDGVEFKDFSIYGELLQATYQNYSTSYSQNISFLESGEPITGHQFPKVDVSSYGNNIDLV